MERSWFSRADYYRKGGNGSLLRLHLEDCFPFPNIIRASPRVARGKCIQGLGQMSRSVRQSS